MLTNEILEKRYFWAVTELNAALRGNDKEEIYEWLGEINTVAFHCDSERLKAKIEKISTAHRFVERRDERETERVAVARDKLAIADAKGDIRAINDNMVDLADLAEGAYVPSNRENAKCAYDRYRIKFPNVTIPIA